MHFNVSCAVQKRQYFRKSQDYCTIPKIIVLTIRRSSLRKATILCQNEFLLLKFINIMFMSCSTEGLKEHTISLCTAESYYSLLNLSSALVLFANPAIYTSSSPTTCKDSFLIVLTIANSTPKIIYNQRRPLKPPQVSSKNCVRKQHKRMK